jgi:hypothetical protein
MAVLASNALRDRSSLLCRVQVAVFLSELLSPRAIFVVLIFILQCHKRIKASKSVALLLERLLPCPSGLSSFWDGGGVLRIYTELRINGGEISGKQHWLEVAYSQYINAAGTSIREHISGLLNSRGEDGV